ncbi:beta-lactamase family protein [Chitinophagaceae bacterium LB-8]|uniref:Beta-lactamase family protein n=1 Tax=Paraflavisolibacter caeni TaxID=2982496 RepID=A0A9X2XMS7_9BACT|nr:serine hydrolase [Paraflavisolibacter caeni]MCU7547828.1 beta-lactamase family protein [Paraflavisolibacter caeni]
MKILKSILLILLSMVLIGSIYAVASGRTYLFKAIWYNFAGIDDYQVFTNNTVAAAAPQPWSSATSYNKKNLPAPLLSMLEGLNTIGLLAVKNDSIVFERYWDGYDQASYSGSFSVTKSITSLLIGIALKEGKIKSLDEPIGNYLPEFRTGEKNKVRIVDLLTMSSGSDFDESYANPLSVTTEMYYGSDVYKVATDVNIIHKPGTFHSYKSGDSQLLGLLLEKATGMSLSQYASKKLWQPLGAEHPALWSTDKEGGHEKAYCCFNSNTRDFARIGQLMLDSGRWKGQEIITKDYFIKSVTPCMIPDEIGEPCNYYGYQWWIFPADEPIFYARGILGQYIIVIPSKKVVLVRLGKQRSELRINGAPAEVDALVKWGKSL